MKTTLTLSRYHVISPPIGDTSTRLLFSMRTGRLWALHKSDWDHLSSGHFHLLSASLLEDLVSSELLVPTTADEFSEVVERSRRAVSEDTTLSMVIQPTALCQLGCSYCGQSHSAIWLSPDQQKQFLNRVSEKLSTSRFCHLDIGWFGGEPLSGLGVIKSMSPELMRLAELHRCSYGASIVTNGLALTSAVATELVRNCSVRRITITLDGVAKFHDVRRHQKDGRPTFDRIFGNLVALAQRTDLDVQINVRSNVDRFNYLGISPFLRLIAEHGIQKRVHYYVAPIHSWGNDAHTRSLAAEEFAQLELGWFAEMIELGFSVALLPELVPIVCLAVRPDAEVVDATGTLFNCTEVSYVPAYGTPNKFAIGTLQEGENPGRRLPIGSFHDRLIREEVPCSSCRMLPVCGGACPKAWLEGYPTCPSAKLNIESRLILAYAKDRFQENRSLPSIAPCVS